MVSDIQRGTTVNPTPLSSIDEDEEGEVDIDQLKPAAQAYSSADEALAKLKLAAADYDDLVLEQFTMPDASCSWCPELYKQLRDLMTASDTKGEQKSYFAEIMAISGRTENIGFLIDSLKNATTQEQKDIFSEALELTAGNDKVTQYLGDQLGTTAGNQQLKESLLAALTNQSTRVAAEIIVKATAEGNDPDGFYSLGIGLGEFVPDDESLPYLQELAQKRDQYSHLAVKALINGGLPGLRRAFDVLTNSKDAAKDQELLKDAADHVTYDEDTEQYLQQVVETSKQPFLVDFAKKVLEDFKGTGEDEIVIDEEGGEEADQVSE
jgi:hypothetical protein